MIRVNRETDYAIGILSLLPRNNQARVNAATVAQRCGLPQPMVSKILKHLTRAGVLESYRGVKGGYGLARDAANISLAEIIVALEGPIALTECVEEGVEACRYGNHCAVSGSWSRINQVVQDALARITLADMAIPKANAQPEDADRRDQEFPVEFAGVRHVSDL